MKYIVKIAILLSIITLSFSCSKEGGDSKNETSSNDIENKSMSALERYETETMKEAKEVSSKSFGANIKVDPNLKVDGVQEDLEWLYSLTPDLSSPLCKKGGIWKEAIDEYPSTFRFFGPESNSKHYSIMALSPYLVDINIENIQYYSMSCSHWAFSKDGKSIYFKLREDMKWSDGKPCTADDFVFYHQAMTSPNVEDPFISEYWSEKKVEKINDYCIKVTSLEEEQLPSYTLLLYLNMFPLPKHAFPNGIEKEWYKKYNYKFLPTTGPYVMKEDENVQGKLLVYEKVKDWWGHKVLGNGIANFDRIEYKVITGGQDIEKEHFYKGELYSYKLNDPQEWKTAAGNEKIANGYIDRWVFNLVPLKGAQGIHFNLKTRFLSDVKVRRALYYAIDIQGMIDNALYGEYTRYHNIGIGHLWGGYDFDDHTIKKPNFNAEKAGEMLSEAGYSIIGNDGIRKNEKGERASFELLYSNASHTERLTILKEQAKKAGVEIELKMMQQGAFNAVLNKNFQAWYGGMSTWYCPTYWDDFSSKNADIAPSNNFYGYKSEQMEKLLEIEKKSGDLAVLSENSKAIQRLVHEDALIIPDCYIPFRRVAMWKWVRFPSWGNLKYADDEFIFNPMSCCFWIDEDIKKEVEEAMKNGKTYEPKLWRLSERYIEQQ